MHITLHSDHST